MGLGNLVSEETADTVIEEAFNAADAPRGPDDTYRQRFSYRGQEFDISLNCSTYIMTAAGQPEPVRDGPYTLTPRLSIPPELKSAFEQKVRQLKGDVLVMNTVIHYDGARRERAFLDAI